MEQHIIKVFRYSDQYKDLAYLIAEVLLTGPLIGSRRKFAREHGGDYIEICAPEDLEDDGGSMQSTNWRRDAV